VFGGVFACGAHAAPAVCFASSEAKYASISWRR
jgi:hypothetical protein